jgi:hypothetical protein
MRELYYKVGFKFDNLDDLEKALEMVGAWDVMRYSSERDFFLRAESLKFGKCNSQKSFESNV